MTEQKAPPVAVTPEPGSRLAQLHAQWEIAKAAADEAAARAKTLSDAIKAETLALVPEGTKAVELTDTFGIQVPLRLIWVDRWELDAKRMKAEDPATYVRYARKGGRWELRKASGK